MLWVLLSLLAGLADAVRDTLSKRASLHIPRELITWSYSLCALPFFLPALFLNRPQELSIDFWLLLLFVSTCHVGGGLALVRALQISELSLCVPMMAFTPVFLLVIGPLIAGDATTILGLIGAFCVTAGSYLLNVKLAREGILAPMRALLSDKGVRIMLGLALLWSVTGSIDRVAVRRYDLFFWASAQLTTIAILLLPIQIKSHNLRFSTLKRGALQLTSLGVSNAFSLVAYLVALRLAPVQYVVCLKRSSILFSIVLGRFLLGEKLSMARLPGALVMLAGAALISFSR